MKLHKIYLTLLAAIIAMPVVNADDDKEEGFTSWLFSVERKNEVRPVKDKLYQEECSACHFAYQPGLLPEASWKKLMQPKSLEDHFGENAELDEETRKHIETYLAKHSADKSMYKRSRKIMASLKSGQAPLRIIDIPYIKRKHDEIPNKMIKANDKVKALSYCDKCHQDAKAGNFDDDSVRVPGYEKHDW